VRCNHAAFRIDDGSSKIVRDVDGALRIVLDVQTELRCELVDLRGIAGEKRPDGRIRVASPCVRLQNGGAIETGIERDRQQPPEQVCS
jgi:hypothetical protein